MRLHLASDHAGFDLKTHLVRWLRERGHEVVDHGPPAYDPVDNYPTYCLRAAEAVAADRTAGTAALGVVLGGSGNGEQIAANKVAGVRAALAWSTETAELARRHNDANVVAVGARMHDTETAIGFVEVFIFTPYSAEERHSRRIAMLRRYEETGELPALPAPSSGAGER